MELTKFKTINYKKDYSSFINRIRSVDTFYMFISDMYKGRMSRFDQVILDKDGHIDDNKLETLINEMLNSYDRYVDLMDQEPLTPEEREFFMTYIYLSITGPSLKSDFSEPAADFQKYVIPEYFDELTCLYHILDQYHSPEELIQSEQNLFSDTNLCEPNFFIYMDHAVCRLTGNPIEAIYNDKELEIFKQLRDIHTCNPQEEGMNIPPEEEFADYEDYLDDYDPVDSTDETLPSPAPDDEYEAYISSLAAEADSCYKAWRKRLPDPDKFVTVYRRMRTVFFDICANKAKLDDAFCTMLDVFLYEYGFGEVAFEDVGDLLETLGECFFTRMANNHIRNMALYS